MGLQMPRITKGGALLRIVHVGMASARQADAVEAVQDMEAA